MVVAQLTNDQRLPWRSVLVYGLGASGRSAATLLQRHGVAVVAADERRAGELSLSSLADLPGISWRLGEQLEEVPSGIEAVVVSPGVPLERQQNVAAKRAGVPVLAEVELAYRVLPAGATVIGITGSNGKSTTTTLVGHLLAGCGRPVFVCGNIGEPMCDYAEQAGVFVVELSSFQLLAIDRFSPHAAALLNVAPDHLDRHGNLAAYRAAKLRLFVNQTASDLAVINADDAGTGELIPGRARQRRFSLQQTVPDGCFLRGDLVVERSASGEHGEHGERELFALSDLPLEGRHNLENAMAAALLALALGATAAELRLRLRTFVGLPHRVERVRVRAGVTWVDDSKGTNPAATERSLEGFADGSVHLILGGRNKDADPAALRVRVAEKVRTAYLIGESAPQFAAALGDLVPCHHAGTLENAVALAATTARSGETVLLSPACASFDQFRNYLHRGERFSELVRALPAEVSDG